MDLWQQSRPNPPKAVRNPAPGDAAKKRARRTGLARGYFVTAAQALQLLPNESHLPGDT